MPVAFEVAGSADDAEVVGVVGAAVLVVDDVVGFGAAWLEGGVVVEGPAAGAGGSVSEFVAWAVGEAVGFRAVEDAASVAEVDGGACA